MKRITASVLSAALLLAVTSCSKEPGQTEELPATTVTEQTEVFETTEETAAMTVTETTAEPPAWEGSWLATDTEEHFEIKDVTSDGFRLTFWHYEEGQIEEFIYKMEFDNPEKTVASEIGTAQDHGGWEYTFTFNGDTILVQSKLPDQIFKRDV